MRQNGGSQMVGSAEIPPRPDSPPDPPDSATPLWAHHLLTSFLTGHPLNFHGDRPPADIQARLNAACAAGTLGGYQ